MRSSLALPLQKRSSLRPRLLGSSLAAYCSSPASRRLLLFCVPRFLSVHTDLGFCYGPAGSIRPAASIEASSDTDVHTNNSYLSAPARVSHLRISAPENCRSVHSQIRQHRLVHSDHICFMDFRPMGCAPRGGGFALQKAGCGSCRPTLPGFIPRISNLAAQDLFTSWPFEIRRMPET